MTMFRDTTMLYTHFSNCPPTAAEWGQINQDGNMERWHEATSDRAHWEAGYTAAHPTPRLIAKERHIGELLSDIEVLWTRLHASEQTILAQQASFDGLAAELHKVTAELEQARAALRPFAAVASDIPDTCQDGDKVHFWRTYWLNEDVTVGHFRNAAAVYQQLPVTGGSDVE